MDDRTRARALVAAQFAALGAWLLLGPQVSPWAVGLVVQAGGIALGAWAGLWMTWRQRRPFSITPVPDAHPELVVDGPYRWVRHPMYTSLLMLVLPAALAGGAVSIAVGAALLAVLVVKHRFEDRLLAARFPGHADWRRRTGGLVPFVG
ncbi:MAG: isoprenylcysteine carboxylmethyltransferase family protein [Burkholderiales bacterium]|jgi:protein-S-isoprenylcysteine O-methyltransferase Ste14